MFWKQKYPVTTGDQRRSDGQDDGDDEHHYFSEKEDEYAESVLSFYKSDEEDEVEVSVEESVTDMEKKTSHNESHDDDAKEDDVEAVSSTLQEDDRKMTSTTYSSGFCCCSSVCTSLISNLLFVFGATLYVWTSYYVYNFEMSYGSVQEEDDTDEDSILFLANANSSSSYVTQFMVYSFASCLCWALQGLWNMCLRSEATCQARVVVHATWTWAALWGMSSAALVVKDQHLSQIFDMVRKHMFVLAAIAMMCSAKPAALRNMSSCRFPLCFCTPVRWLRLADLFLILGTLSDVILGYFMLYKVQVIDNTPIRPIHLLYGAMATAACWGLVSLMYLASSFMEICFASPYQRNPVDNQQCDVGGDQESELRVHDDDDDSVTDRPNYLPHKTSLKQEFTEDTANDEASVSSFSSWWSAGPSNKAGVAKSSLDSIFGRYGGS